MLSEILSEITINMWIGAVIGTVVSVMFGALWKLFQVCRSLRPIKRVLGNLTGNEEGCAIFVKRMIPLDHKRSGRYFSHVPQNSPRRRQGIRREWSNISYVFAAADMDAATDFLNLLGQVGKKENIEFKSIEHEYDLWDTHIVSIGGNCKGDAMISLYEPRFAYLEGGGFRLSNSEEVFEANGRYDYGLVFKCVHPQTGKRGVVLMGSGELGTKGASYYLRMNAGLLGKVFGPDNFAFVVRVEGGAGKESAEPHWMCPAPKWWRKALHHFFLPANLWDVIKRVG